MGYRESLDYLYGLQRFGIKLGLDNINRILDRLQRPEASYLSVHVAGSNGKGSVCAGISSILVQAGHKTGFYSSPHLHSFTERIRIDGQQISEAEAVELISAVRCVSQDLPVTFFEFTTAMALLHFQRRQVHAAILEVGMGGRLDATNAIQPRIAVVTPICRDHSEHLGNSLAQIAAEKAGIVKAKTPLVVGAQPSEALSVLLQRAAALEAPVCVAGRDFFVEPAAHGFAYRGLDVRLSDLQCGLAGDHQQHNMGVALAVCELLARQGVDLPVSAMRRGVATVSWAGRLEWWRQRGEVLLDGAHNEGGAQVLAAYLGSLSVAGIRWVAAAKANKDVEGILGPLLPRVNQLYCTVPPVENAVPPATIVGLADAFGVPGRCYDTPATALQAALADRRQNEIVLVAGSLFLVAAAREFLQGLEGEPG